MILDRYLAWRFVQSFAMIAAVFLSLIMLIELIEQLRRFEGLDVTLGQMFYLIVLHAPTAVNEILPLLMILSTIVLYVGLARSSELVATRATGRSGIRALLAPMLVALIVGILAVSTLNPIVAATSNHYQKLIDTYRSGGPSALSISSEGLWLRQGETRGQSVIHATGFTGTEENVVLEDVTILTYATGVGPIRRIHAQSARLEDNTWVLTKTKVWPLMVGVHPETSATYHDVLQIRSTLTDERIRDSLGRPTGVSIYDLPETIRELKRAGFSTKRHEVWLQSELARPLFLMAMVLVGAAFTMRHTRFGGTGIAVLSAVLLGFGLYFIRNFAQILGENGQLPVPLAAWGPPVASILLTIGLLLHAEDG